MPRIFDNIEQRLLPALRDAAQLAYRADFCVGYFNLRGWSQLGGYIKKWSGGDGNCCRLLIGMQERADDELKEALGLRGAVPMDNSTANKRKKQAAERFREQLTTGTPSAQDEETLRRLAAQIKNKQLCVKLFLSHRLHAKLYLLYRNDPINPIMGYLGSSNLTFAGLAQQGELNIDVSDTDAGRKLSTWFEERWNDPFCVDISTDLINIIGESWAREDLIPPFHIYVKMAYHLSQEARAGLSEFRLPRDFGDKLFPFQAAAVKIAAHHLNKRGGVLLGDVVGLGKTLMATALARIFEDDQGLETLIICPKNLQKMWEDYKMHYRLRAEIVPLSQVMTRLPGLPRHRIVLIDESHNLRNSEGQRYKVIHEYIQRNESKCILLSATPYNKTYRDLSSQLGLFVDSDLDLGIRPEHKLRELGETEFIRQHQCRLRSLAAFEHSEFADDWRELMRLYLVRRTRSFIQENYAFVDCPACGMQVKASEATCSTCGRPKQPGDRRYLVYEDGSHSYFPLRLPKTMKFVVDEASRDDQYARLYSDNVVDVISHLQLPRYGLGNYVTAQASSLATVAEKLVLRDLSRAGKRLMGFCRTNLFKRLESSGKVFLESVESHILRNFIFIYAMETQQPIPIGPQGADLLDAFARDSEEDIDDLLLEEQEDDGSIVDKPLSNVDLLAEGDFRQRAQRVYQYYWQQRKRSFKWLPARLFSATLKDDLYADARVMMDVLRLAGPWNVAEDNKLAALHHLLAQTHAQEKVLVFTQFADTVDYLAKQLTEKGLQKLEGVSGNSENPTAVAWRFSPESNEKRAQVGPEDELRVVIATDVLSEGQNLQDCSIVVNYDLPWAIIRLVQRVGRVDRIGQKAPTLTAYSFLPAEGVERILRLRQRVRQRLSENGEVVGSDEQFFEDDHNDQAILDLYNEKAGILDGDADTEVDLASYAYEIWNKASAANPSLKKTIPAMPNVVLSTKQHMATSREPAGVLVYVRTGEGNDALAWVDREGKSVTQSQFDILRAAACLPQTPALPRQADHHDLVRKGVLEIAVDEKRVGGQLGRPSGARYRTYHRLETYLPTVRGMLFEAPLKQAMDDIYRYPLRPVAADTLNRQLRSDISDDALAQLVIALRDDGRLCDVEHEPESEQEPQIICSLGLAE